MSPWVNGRPIAAKGGEGGVVSLLKACGRCLELVWAAPLLLLLLLGCVSWKRLGGPRSARRGLGWC
jgi:hypothetical protein